MKKKTLILISAMLVFGLAIAIYASNRTNGFNFSDKAACCCSKGDSCPMKSKEMDSTSQQKHEGNCCCSCCGESCPMKKKDAKTVAEVEKASVVVQSESMSCCSGGCCCNAKEE